MSASIRPASRMSRTARVLVALAGLLLGTLYFTPLWSVRLVAPQYPEGLGMNIRLNTVEGVKEFDLRNINSLNHYIGMKAIEPDAIPELRYMPWIVAGLIVTAFVVAIAGRRRLLVAWAGAFALLGAAGMYDFWRWGYDYGHNLDIENAIIIVPGMTYQPPLVGTKQLLNFTATSLPATGGVAAGVAFALALVALALSYRRRSQSIPVLAAAAVAGACVSGVPQAIAIGVDQCVECRMVVSDSRFGAVLVTAGGKSLKFDSVDCLLEHLGHHEDRVNDPVWVMDAGAPGSLVPAAEAWFVSDGSPRPPMGSLVAFGSENGARSADGVGEPNRWTALLAQSGRRAAHAG